ncbi:MAG: hypothetical protein K2W95_22095 [Candidatus Obscuribacterales bacterium]|nr:hypothetical protein [Candidatus Obscuribacterales bacterium]
MKNWFKINRRNAIIGGVIAALVMVAIWLIPSGGGPEWPQFPETQDKAPSVVSQLEPDFGYRTGDVIPVSIFIKEQLGTEIDISSIAFEGDFEIRGEPQIAQGQTPEGAKQYCIKLNLQSFSMSPKLRATMSMQWNLKGDRQWKEVKHSLVNAFTSLTWDGERKEIQSGPLVVLSSWWKYFSPGLMVFAVLLFGGCLFYQRWFERAEAAREKKVQASARAVCKTRVDTARKAIGQGDVSEAQYVAIAAALREYFNIESTVIAHIPQALGDHHPYKKRVQAAINLCERVAYKSVNLTAFEQKHLFEFLDDILLRRNAMAEQDPDYILNRKQKPAPVKVSKVKVVTASQDAVAADVSPPPTDAPPADKPEGEANG